MKIDIVLRKNEFYRITIAHTALRLDYKSNERQKDVVKDIFSVLMF